MPEQQQDKQQDVFEITTTAQVERVYVVQGSNEDQAHTRLRAHLKDADSLREGLVVEQADKQIDATPQKVKKDGVKKITKPRAVAEAAAS